jgi:hypothetical protein
MSMSLTLDEAEVGGTNVARLRPEPMKDIAAGMPMLFPFRDGYPRGHFFAPADLFGKRQKSAGIGLSSAYPLSIILSVVTRRGATVLGDAVTYRSSDPIERLYLPGS